MKIRAVVFDMDDTLYAERDYVRSGYRAIAGRLDEMLNQGRREKSIFETISPDDWLWERFVRGESSGAFDALNEEFALGLSEAGILELVNVYRIHKPDIRPHAGVVKMLERLGEQFSLGLISDGFLPGQQYKLDVLGLRPYFDAVLFTESLGRKFWKPSPAGFQAIREQLNVEHEACAYIADNPAKDFIAPNALGWLTVQYLRPHQVHSHKPAPKGGTAKIIVRTDEELVNWLIG